MTTINHWGVTIDTDEPITGVFTASHFAQFVSDSMYDGIDLNYEAWQDDHDCPNPDDCECEYESWGTWEGLIGDWLKDDEGKYYPNPEGEYAIIVGEIYMQVVFSKYIKHNVGLCSPCYPGQADPDSKGQMSCYDLPPWAYDVQ